MKLKTKIISSFCDPSAHLRIVGVPQGFIAQILEKSSVLEYRMFRKRWETFAS